jgi:hypothetical protein
MTSDQLAKWKAADRARKRQQRNQRGRRKRGLATVTRAGMVRVSPARHGESAER